METVEAKRAKAAQKKAQEAIAADASKKQKQKASQGDAGTSNPTKKKNKAMPSQVDDVPPVSGSMPLDESSNSPPEAQKQQQSGPAPKHQTLLAKCTKTKRVVHRTAILPQIVVLDITHINKC